MQAMQKNKTGTSDKVCLGRPRLLHSPQRYQANEESIYLHLVSLNVVCYGPDSSIALQYATRLSSLPSLSCCSPHGFLVSLPPFLSPLKATQKKSARLCSASYAGSSTTFDMIPIHSCHSLCKEMINLMKHCVPYFDDPVCAALLVAMKKFQVCSIHEHVDLAAPHEPP